MRMRQAVGMVAMLGLVGPVLAVGTTAQGQEQKPRPLIQTLSTRLDLSPDHDGRRDGARGRYMLSSRARVSASVWHDGSRVRGPVRLGPRAAGRHAWTWDGRDNAGHVVDEGSYTVRLLARGRSRTQAARLAAVVDTTPPRGSVRTSRPTVHPRATSTRDRVQLVFLTRGWNAFDAEFGDRTIKRTRLEIRNARGRLVFASSRQGGYTPRFSWTARTSAGTPLPSGEYVARITVTDLAGNRRHWDRGLAVSDAGLAPAVWTTTVPASQAMSYDAYYGGCNGCGDFCDPIPSGRYPGGLSFAPCASAFTGWSARYFSTSTPFEPAPVDRYRITATEGPGTPGGDDTARLVVGERAGVEMTGDASTVSPWMRVRLGHQPNLPTFDRPVLWYAGTSPGTGDTYDVASFTIEYQYFVPAP